MTVYAPRNDIGNVDYLLDAGVAILDYFDTLFGVQYPQLILGILFVLESWKYVFFIQQNTRNSELRITAVDNFLTLFLIELT